MIGNLKNCFRFSTGLQLASDFKKIFYFQRTAVFVYGRRFKEKVPKRLTKNEYSKFRVFIVYLPEIRLIITYKFGL